MEVWSSSLLGKLSKSFGNFLIFLVSNCFLMKQTNESSYVQAFFYLEVIEVNFVAEFGLESFKIREKT